MIRALQSSPLGRQPFTLGTTNTTTLPLQRFVAQACRRNVTPKTASTRAVQTGARGNTTTGCAGYATSAPFRPSPLTLNHTTIGSKGRLLSRTQKRNFNWSWPRRSPANGGQAEETLSLSGRLKKLSREYGWAAVGVYFALSVLDFPFCFLLVKWVGTERIAAIEEWVIDHIKRVIPDSVQQQWHDWRTAAKGVAKHEPGDNSIPEDIEKVGWGVERAQEAHKADASLATQLALAYAIHKSFIFVRVPLAAAVTPKVVKVLRSWGWQIGNRKPKKPKSPNAKR